MQLPEGWKEALLAEMDRRFRVSQEKGKWHDEALAIDDTQIGVEFAIDFIGSLVSAVPIIPSQDIGLPADVLNCLRFYANGEHFTIDDDAQEFDTVSGEPDNWLHSQKDDDCTMIEHGGLAKAVLQGKKINGEMDSPPVYGEKYRAIG